MLSSVTVMRLPHTLLPRTWPDDDQLNTTPVPRLPTMVFLATAVPGRVPPAHGGAPVAAAAS